MNNRKLFNSKLLKVTISLLIILVAILGATFVYDEIAEQKVIDDIMGKVNIDSGDVGYQGNATDISGENPIKKLSEDEFILDRGAKTISINENLVGGSFCISISPDGPTENDSWKLIENESISLDESEQIILGNGEEQKVYVYYMAGTTSTMTAFNTSADIYTISTATELNTFASKVNAGTNFSGKKVILLNSISASSVTPIGTSSNPFKGTFDGCGYTISNVSISKSGTANVGLFGYVTDGTIKNLTVTGSGVTGGEATGAIAGYMTGTLQNCKSSVTTVSGTTVGGGIVGSFGGTIKYCQNTSEVTVTDATGTVGGGGIVGKLVDTTTIFNCNNAGTISGRNIGGILGSTNTYLTTLTHCTNSGTVTSSTSNAGGIVGSIADCTSYADTKNKISNCKNIGTISVTGYNAGGIVGAVFSYVRVEVTYCINEGNITSGNSGSGGIVGRGAGNILDDSIVGYQGIYIYYCFNSGAITGEGKSGGILGFDGDTDTTYTSEVMYCGNTGTVTISTENAGSSQSAGGIVGRMSDGIIEYCYNTGNITGYRYNAGIIGTFAGSQNVASVNYCYAKCSVTNTQGATAAACIGIWHDVATNIWKETSYKNNYYDVTKSSSSSSIDYAFKRFDSAGNLVGYKNLKTEMSSLSSYFFTDTYSQNDGNEVLAWQVQPTIIRNPYDVIKPTGQTATLDFVVYGATSAMSYQWYSATSETGTGTALSGKTSATLSATVTPKDTWYYCVITGKDTSGNSVTATTKRALVGTGEYSVSMSASRIEASINPTSYTYTGSEIKPEVTVKDGTTTLTQSTDYTVEYKNNINVGDATAIITGKGKYDGTKTLTFSITQATPTVIVSITGETSIGKTLMATALTSTDGTKSYQWWYSSTAGATSGIAISGATSSTYTVTSSVVGYYIGVTVSVAESTNYKACSGTAITTSKVAGTNYSDNAGKYYETLKEAFDNAASGSTITVLRNVEDNSVATVASGKSFVLDLNGKVITVNGITSGAFIDNVGTLEVKDNTSSGGTIDISTTAATRSVYLIECKSTTAVTTVTSGTYKVTSNAYYPSGIYGNGIINIKGGNLVVTNTGTSGWSAGIYTANGTVNITGGTIDVTASSSAISVQGIVNQGSGASTINISGGTINSSGYGIRLGNDSGTTENDGSILNISGTAVLNTSKSAIYNTFATGGITITGGTIKSTNSNGLYSSAGTVTIGTDDGTVSQTSPVIQGTTGVYSTSSFNFYDGILKGGTVGHYGTLTPASGYGLQYGTEVIDGTTYQTEILALTNWSDGKSVYSTLEESFEKAKTGSTITALKDIKDDSVNATLNKSMVIDLDEHVVNMLNSSINVESGGNLEIIGKTGSKITSGNDTAIVNSGGSVILGTTEGDISNWVKVEGNKKGATGDITMNGGTLIGTDNPPYGTKPTTEREYFEIVTNKNGIKYETTIQLEQVPPEITITPSTEKPTNEYVILTIKVTDNFSGVKKVTYELDGKVYDLTLNSSGIGTIKVLENGTYTIYAEDNAGNKSNKTYEVKNIDRIPDNVTGASVQDATGKESKVKYATIVLENITTDSVLPSEVVEILISNSSTGVGTGIWIPYETDMKAPWVLDTTDGNGEKTIYIWAKDNAGNISENPFSLKVTLDTKLIGGTKNKIDLSFAGIDKNFDRSELQNYQIGYKTGNASAIATQTELSKIDEKFTYGDKTGEKFSLTTRNIKGAGKLYVTVATRTLYDKAGNVNDLAEIETDYTIDTNAPTITYDTGSGNVKITDTEGNLKAITVDGKTITISNDETYNISSGYIRAYDLAGNVAELSL